MKLLKKISNPIELQVLCDALQEQGIEYQVDNAGMHALMPLPDIMDVRLRVAGQNMTAARQVLADIERAENA